ncbi:hypothetical protein PY310_07450 [Pseudarthrobacter sp. H3Y2-7]|uniref:hypothetical protein n=1 Tax=Pseudarthrobacter naphthalenicus TaxID=3031328 RepID=UPI0023B11F56|nr:hypothetical protein [Pseudarthrobacter sp. H3Y2-7]MDE8668414.1 hypothetical protein [Pseudarthrobacter sp. H3Y2-7]
MVIRHIPERPDLSYHLIHYDKNGDELPEGTDKLGSTAARSALAAPGSGITDVFLLSHGWNSDVEGAMQQYDAWLTMSRETRPSNLGRPFSPLIIGVHWPSKAWGDDTIISTDPVGLLGGEATPTGVITVEDAVDMYSTMLVDSLDTRDALGAIFDAAADPGGHAAMTDTVRRAYLILYRELHLEEARNEDPIPAAAWDPAKAFEQALEDTDKESGLLSGDSIFDRVRDAILAPLRQLSFWTMKARALTFGENGAAKLLRDLQNETDESVRFHLMGHSFGSIVVSAAVAGTDGITSVRPVSSLFLVQGALSLWAYAGTVPEEANPGHFHRIIQEEIVRGPIVTTRSTYDYAVGRFYPLGAGIAGEVLLGDLPRYGGLGAFGIQGVKGAHDVAIGDETTNYGLKPGGIYNIDASSVISKVSGPGGAHSDITHPATAALAWQAALAMP